MHITDQAQQELVRFARVELVNEEFIRIARAYQCGASRFQLTIDDARTPMDEVIVFDGAEVIVESTCLELLAECQLDFDGDSFVFIDDAGSQC